MKNFTRICYAIAFLMAGLNQVNAQNITVSMAGFNAAFNTGDGGSSLSAQIGTPTDVCVDAANNIYIADGGFGVVRKISAQTGVITTFAGGGSSTADGIPATDASLVPAYMCMDNAGNLYLTTGNQIRVINLATGIINTVAGSTTAGHGGDGGPATAALLNGPGGICRDATGNIYFVDGGTFAWLGSGALVTYIRKIDAATGIISTIAGTGVAGYSGDGGPSTAAQIQNSVAICVDASGNVFFSDQPSALTFGGGAYIRVINAATGIINTMGGTGGYPANGDGGLVSAACLGNIYGMCFDHSGNLCCCDISCSCRKIDMSTGIINTIAGNVAIDGYNGDGGNSINEYFNWPYGVSTDAAGNLLIADNNNYRIRRVVQLTHTPAFVYGQGQSINTCPGIANALTNLLAIGDLDALQTETWTVIAGPTHGTLSGFPATAISQGTDSVAIPVATSYTSSAGYTGMDSFKISVSDGALSSIITVYVNVNMSMPGSLTGPSALCIGAPSPVSDMMPNGVWGSYNSSMATVVADSTWYDASAMGNGTDTIYYSTSVGCDAITVYAGTDAGTIAGSPSVCTSATTVLNDAAAGGVWSAFNGNATVSGAGIVTGVTAGTDTIYYSVTNTCGTASASQVVTIDDCTTGVPSPSLSLSISIFPNPTSAALTVLCMNWQNDNSAVVITDMTGRELYKTTLAVAGGKASAQIDVTTLPTGVYFIKVGDNDVRKFVKD